MFFGRLFVGEVKQLAPRYHGIADAKLLAVNVDQEMFALWRFALSCQGLQVFVLGHEVFLLANGSYIIANKQLKTSYL